MKLNDTINEAQKRASLNPDDDWLKEVNEILSVIKKKYLARDREIYERYIELMHPINGKKPKRCDIAEVLAEEFRRSVGTIQNTISRVEREHGRN